MSIPFFLPPPSYIKPSYIKSSCTRSSKASIGKTNYRKIYTISELCKRLKIPCRATGVWTQRKVEIFSNYSKVLNYNTISNHNTDHEIIIFAEPGDWGKVEIFIPKYYKNRELLALYILAYGMHDIVAKESILQAKLNPAYKDILRATTLNPPRGRPKKQRALSTKERQKRYREKKLFFTKKNL